MADENTNEKISRYQAALEIFKLENQLLWQRFGAFLLIHTVLLAFIIKNFFEQNQLIYPNQSLFFTGIAGLILCVLWALTYSRSWRYSHFRTAQVCDSEPSNWNLIAGDGKKFADGESVTIGSKQYRMKGLERISIRCSFWGVILLFALIYMGVIIVSWPWWGT